VLQQFQNKGNYLGAPTISSSWRIYMLMCKISRKERKGGRAVAFFAVKKRNLVKIKAHAE